MRNTATAFPLFTRDAPREDLRTRRATIEADAIDEASRTVRVVFSTGADVQRQDLTGAYVERLSLATDHVNLDALIGSSVLNSHRQHDVTDVIGTVVEAWTDGTRGWAKVKLSARADVEPIYQDIRAGVIKFVSVGYTVEKSREDRAADGTRVMIAEAWTPRELSFVAVPADPGAQVRAAERSGVDAEIRSLVSVAGLAPTFAETLITRQATVAEARQAAFNAMAHRAGPEIRSQATPYIVAGHDWTDPEIRCAHMGEALYLRINPNHRPSDAARPYVGMSLADFARESLRARGMLTTGASPATLITRSLHTTSDFSLILADTVNRDLRRAYQTAPAGVRSLARQTTARDFRLKHRLMLGEAPTLQKVNEHGEFTSGTMAEAEETYKPDTFGRIFGITRQALVNDDVGAFADLSGRMAAAAMEFEAQFLVDLLTSQSGVGPDLADTDPLFDANHGNIGTGGAIGESTLSEARTAMRTQTGLSGKPINIPPKYLLVPAPLETTAEKQVAAIQANTVDDVNVFGGRLQIVVEARLDAVSIARWYIVADPMQADGLEYCYLEGSPGPQVETQNGFEIDGVKIKVRLDYGAGFVDFRSWFVNHGS